MAARSLGLVLAAAASLVLAGCGGSGGGAGGAAGGGGAAKPGDWKGKMPEVMKPCAAAVKEAGKLAPMVKSGKASGGEAVEAADAAVAACETAHAAWSAMDMPPEVAEPCMEEAGARLGGAYATRSALNHQVSPPYKKRMDVFTERAKRFETACKTAVKDAKA